MMNVHNSSAEHDWDAAFRDFEGFQLPLVSKCGHTKTAWKVIHQDIQWLANTTDLFNSLRAAWATILAQYASSDDVIFGVRLRTSPDTAILPMRVNIDWQSSVETFLQSIKTQAMDMAPYENRQLEHLQPPSSYEKYTSQLQTLLVLTPEPAHVDANESQVSCWQGDISDETGHRTNHFSVIVQCNRSDKGAVLRFYFDEEALDFSQAERMVYQLQHVLRQLSRNDYRQRTKLVDLDTVSESDKQDIWSWNSSLPRSINYRIHDLVTARALNQPDSTAVHAWDGTLSYRELDTESSALASFLIRSGIAPGDIVPLCVEKSYWTTIIILAIAKAGACFVVFDPTLPVVRLVGIMKELRADLVIARPATEEFASALAARVVVVDYSSLVEYHSAEALRPICSSPSDALYVIFTSGSTGTPKGVVISHANLCSAALHQARELGFSGARSFDSSSYSFDAYVFNTFYTLLSGGCLCVPAENDRINSLQSALQSMQVTLVQLTPSVARLLTPESLPELRTLILTGEKLNRADLVPWLSTRRVKVINVYGPTECTIMCAANTTISEPEDANKIGRGLGASLWIMDPKNSSRLAPIGAVGELMIEGPLIGQGYLYDEVKSKATLNSCPPGSLAGIARGPSGPLFKTGDLVRYNSDGSISYIGRGDTQLKLNGQRVETGEVEYHLSRNVPKGTEIVVEIVEWPSGVTRLLAFVCRISDSENYLPALVAGLCESLSDALPRHMIPSAFYRIGKIPMTASGKTDRRKLRQTAVENPDRLVYYDELHHKDMREATSTSELALQQLWADVLGVDSSSIGANDSFLRHGDSLAAMRLVIAARAQGYILTVADVFKRPRLSDLALKMGNTSSDQQQISAVKDVAPFSLVGAHEQGASLQSNSARACHVDPSDVEDVYPCSALQEAMLAQSARRPGNFITQEVLPLSPSIDLARLKSAWKTLIAATPILRTRIVEIPAYGGLFQVVISEPAHLTQYRSVDECIREEGEQRMGMAARLFRFALVDTAEKTGRAFVLTMHHSIYDGWFMRLLMDELRRQYRAEKGAGLVPFRNFIDYLSDVNQAQAAEFWKDAMKNMEAPQSPSLPATTYEPSASSLIEHRIRGVQWTLPSGSTPTTVLRAAWAILLSKYANSTDVVFGTTVLGRQIPLAGIERVGGPTIATIPVRVLLNWHKQRVEELLQEIQIQGAAMIPFQHFGLNRIRRLNADTDQACQFQSVLVVQPHQTEKSEEDFNIGGGSEDIRVFNTYAIMVECSLEPDGVNIRLSFDDGVVDRKQAQLMVQQMEHVIRQLCSDERALKLADLEVITPQEKQRIWSWNNTPPEAIRARVHDLFTSRVMKQPSAPAVSAWDGELSYHQLENISTRLSQKLVESGIGPGDIVPMCFEKSIWTTITLLAVAKAGGTFVALDPGLPLARLSMIVTEELKAELILASPAQADLARSLAANVLVIDEVTLSTPVKPAYVDRTVSLPCRKPSSPSDCLYIVFTSGSTGRPKGVRISHSNLCSAVTHQAPALGFSKASRSFDSSSYSFDAYVFNTFYTLLSGGCLCVASDLDRVNNLSHQLQSMRVTIAQLTPSVARILKPEAFPDLRVLILTGEPLSQFDVLPWMDKVRVVNAYGPSECTIMCAANTSLERVADVHKIGYGLGANLWIKDPFTTELAAIGVVGELMVEGPLVGLGYLNDEAKTQGALEQNPLWITRGVLGQPRRVATLFKTGDLARYNTDGSITLTGRADAQMKLHGQRIEAGEIEHHLREALPDGAECAIEVVELPPMPKQLLAFVCSKEDDQVLDNIALLVEKLSTALPRHMVPSRFLPVDRIPLNASGKTDRRRLKQTAAEASPASFLDRKSSRSSRTTRQPSTSLELMFQRMWAGILNTEASSIAATDDFFQRGGDSISAMRLVPIAREEGLSITVDKIFRYPRLSDMASQATSQASTRSSDMQIPPFSLLDQSLQTSKLAKSLDVDVSDIEDAYPCSALQEGMLALTAQGSNQFVAKGEVQLPENIDVERFRWAWDRVVSSLPILRTRIVEYPGHGLLQVVVKKSIAWSEYDNLGRMSNKDQEAMGLREPLVRFALVKLPQGHPKFFLTIHHALYDRWFARLLLKQVESIYAGTVTEGLVSYNVLIKHLVEADQSIAEEYWRSLLANTGAPQFPTLPSPMFQPAANTIAEHTVESLEWASDATQSTTLRAAWAILISQYTNSIDVVFGATSMGRQIPVPGIERVAGPTIATVPVRLQLDWKSSFSSLLLSVQKQALETISFEHFGLGRIRRLTPETEQACQFQSLVVVQPADAQTDESQIFYPSKGNDDIQDFNTYAIMLECSLLANGGVTLRLSFDNRVIDDVQAERMLCQLEHVLRQLGSGDADVKRLIDIEATTELDQQQIWSWNATVPESTDCNVWDLMGQRFQEQPNAIAICAWDGELSYRELDDNASKLAHTLVQDHGVTPELAVPICIEKSVWTPVVMLGVIRAGGTAVIMDASHPEERLQSIVDQTSARIVLASPVTEERARKLSSAVLVINADFFSGLLRPSSSLAPRVGGSSSLLIVFTSGSSGTPKGATMTHGNFSSALLHQKKQLNMTRTTRVLDFASYSFDAVWFNLLHTLYAGGCLCIPSDDDRRDNLAGTIRQLEANYVLLTPSLGRSLDPASVPNLKDIVLGGEPVSRQDFPSWGPDVKIRVAYGPSECTVISTVAVYGEDFVDSVNLGRTYGLNSWIVSCVREDTLAPIGAVGELLLEGPLVGKGYIGDPDKTAAAFVEDCPWLLKGCEGHQGRKGRVYKTGDLVKYNSDGRIAFVARKDTQVKIRGQRVELEEIEVHARRLLGGSENLAAEVLLVGQQNTQVLVMFISASEDRDGESLTLREAISSTLNHGLAASLPSYMVPRALIPVKEIPLTTSGKVDRKRLRQIGAQMSIDQIIHPGASQTGPKRQPVTENERSLQQIWSNVLRIATDKIGLDDNFFELGGDSIAAMRLAGTARELQQPLSVATIFRQPRLGDMARAVVASRQHGNQVASTSASLEPKETLPVPAVAEVSRILSIDEDAITDVLPVTDFQRHCIECALRRPRTEWNYFTMKFETSVDAAKLVRTCVKLSQSVEILRSLFVRRDQSYFEVFLEHLKPQVDVHHVSEPLDEASSRICQQDLDGDVSLGESFTRYFVINSVSEKRTMLVMRISHAQYDGISFSRIADSIGALYDDRPLPALDGFSGFLRVSASRPSEDYAYWENLLRGSSNPVLPSAQIESAPSSILIRQPRLQKDIALPSPRNGTTTATIMSAAWGVALSRVQRSPDVVFRRLVSGRNDAAGRHGAVVGPCINEVPVRMRVLDSHAAAGLLADLQEQFVAGMPHEALGLRDIAKRCTDWPAAAPPPSIFQFQNVEVQPAFRVAGQDVKFSALDTLDRADAPGPLRMMAVPCGDRCRLELRVPPGSCGLDVAQRLLDEFCAWLEEL